MLYKLANNVLTKLTEDLNSSATVMTVYSEFTPYTSLLDVINSMPAGQTLHLTLAKEDNGGLAAIEIVRVIEVVNINNSLGTCQIEIERGVEDSTISNFNVDDTVFLAATESVFDSLSLKVFEEQIFVDSPNDNINVARWNLKEQGNDVSIAFAPTGTGGLLASVPDNTPLGGNVRGNYSIDLQLVRTEEDQVAAGTHSAIISGSDNRVDGNFSIVLGGMENLIDLMSSRSSILGGGENEINSSSNSILGGGVENKIISSGNSVIVGGINNEAENTGNSFIGGGIGNKAENAANSFIGGGNGNKILFAVNSMIVGGLNNEAENVSNSFIGGGIDNKISFSANAVIVGGLNNEAENADISFIGGGNGNKISSTGYSVIVGGLNNEAENAGDSFIGGGTGNKILSSGFASADSVIVGGFYNEVENARDSFIGSGVRNKVSNSKAVVVGGLENESTNTYSFVANGGFNTSSGSHSFIGNGNNNKADSDFSVTLNGTNNETSGTFSITFNGNSNIVSGDYSAILTGNGNEVSGDYSFIVSGNGNEVSGDYSFILSGNGNEAYGNYAVCLGGTSNESGGNFSLTFGIMAKATHDGSMVLTDSQSTEQFSAQENEARLRFENGMFLNDRKVSTTFALVQEVDTDQVVTYDELAPVASWFDSSTKIFSVSDNDVVFYLSSAPVGFYVDVYKRGDGDISFEVESSFLLFSMLGEGGIPKLTQKGKSVRLLKRTINEWIIDGDVE